MIFFCGNFKFASTGSLNSQIIKEDKPLPKTNAFHHIKGMFVSLEVFNLLQIDNTVSYTWITDVTNRQYAVPNYLTRRTLNLKLQVKF